MRILAVVVCLGMSIVDMTALSAVATSTPRPPADLVERFLQSAAPRLVAYRAQRTLEASSMGGQMHASIDVITYLDPDGTFRFEVVRESGSSLIRDRVLVAALKTEQRSYNRHETDLVELTPRNYEFSILPGTTPHTARLRLVARRNSTTLLNGSAAVTDDGELLRIEGAPAELPSYWTRRVDVMCQYARINGVRVTTELRSRADVRIAGESAFSMTYTYTMINGRPVNGRGGGST